ncbi:MAG TPA: rhomboid family intramembrane serine protease [Syntrophomonas sp.]|nr:rhomboid family intramembrane serine protease [Syntrophomonas sp.]HRW12107.1 rhomboid family intramembrane serine protease [Syntrophomonas sp.]
MIPLRDSTPSDRFPLVTVVLILINLLIFMFETTLGSAALEALVYTYGLVPSQMIHYNGPLTGYLPFISSTFLHGSWMHVIGNMWVLWLFGDNVEDKMGHGRFLFFYLLCGLVAGITHVAFEPGSQVPVVGASGAAAGIMGAYFLMFRHARVFTYIPPIFLFNIPAGIYLGFWALTQLFYGTFQTLAQGQIAFWAHVGGFAAGMIIYRFFLQARNEITEV